MRFSIAIASVMLATIVPLGAAARTMTVSDVRHIVEVTSPQISPDGREIAIIVSRTDYDNNDYRSDLVLVRVVDGALRTIVHDRSGLSSPQWSPSGDRIAFIASNRTSDNPTDQIFVMPSRGGKPQQITKTPNDIQVFAWRPDGNAIAYATEDEPPNKKAIQAGHDEFEVGDDTYLITAAPTPAHVWVVAAAGGLAKRITSGSWSLPSLDVATPLSWSPDGKHIAITKWPNAHAGDSNPEAINIVDVVTGQERKLTQHGGFEGYAIYSPDGSKIAYWYPANGDGLNGTRIFVAPSSGGDGVAATAALDRDVAYHAWMPNGKSLVVCGTDGTRVAIWHQPLGGQPHRLDLGPANPTWDNSCDMDVGRDGSIAFAGSEHKRPTELYYLRSPGAPTRRLTDFNHSITALDLGNVKHIGWQGPDGFVEDGVLTYPPGFLRAKKYPLVMEIHGGPNYTSTEEFWDKTQLIAAQGYLVFQPNYRGSDNLGDAYEHAIFNDAGDGPGRDVMAGLKAVEDLGIVDTSRIAVEGLSYGGYMSAWMASHYSDFVTDIQYSAATSPLEQYDLEDFNVAESYYFKTSPWVSDQTMQAYRDQSPITYANRIKIPTLIVANTGDIRVPITSSFAMYHALKDNRVPVKFIAFPESGHTVTGPVHVEDLLNIWIGWLHHYLG